MTWHGKKVREDDEMNGREKVKGVKKSTSQGKKLMETEKGSTALKLEIFFSLFSNDSFVANLHSSPFIHFHSFPLYFLCITFLIQ